MKYFKATTRFSSKNNSIFFSMNDGTDRAFFDYAPSGPVTLPERPIFKSVPNAQFIGWSDSPFGNILPSSVTITKDTVLYARWDLKITLMQTNGTEDPVEIVATQQKNYVLPDCPFEVPFGRIFEGWSYVKEGSVIGAEGSVTETQTIDLIYPLTLYAKYTSGLDNWVQIMDYDDPIDLDIGIQDIYKYNDSSKIYRLNGLDFIYNSLELTGLQVRTTVNVSSLPSLADCDVLYHRTTDDTYWHFEYDILESIDGFPARADNNYWENVNIINYNEPKIKGNTYEVYYLSANQRMYIYDYLNDQWVIQNPDDFNLSAYATIQVSQIKTQAAPEFLPDKLFKIEKTVSGHYYYCWARLVEGDYHKPQRPTIDPTIYWVIDNSGNLWVGAHPIISNDVKHQGNFPSTQRITGTDYHGPWTEWRPEIVQITFLEPISPISLESWFDGMSACQRYINLDNIKTDYVLYCCNTFASMSAVLDEKKLDLSSWTLDSCVDINGMFCWGDLGTKTRTLDELDISGMNTSKVTNMKVLFHWHRYLQHIYVGDKWTTSKVTNFDRMFQYTERLHNYKSSYQAGQRAFIDNGSNGGYFERKCVVTLKPNNNVGDPIIKYVKKNDSFTLPPNTFPTGSKWVFLGWSTSTDEKDIITSESIEITSDITLYAIWQDFEE